MCALTSVHKPRSLPTPNCNTNPAKPDTTHPTVNTHHGQLFEQTTTRRSAAHCAAAVDHPSSRERVGSETMRRALRCRMRTRSQTSTSCGIINAGKQ
eukprot:286890-Alexandrium_andersonii.AAC.1